MTDDDLIVYNDNGTCEGSGSPAVNDFYKLQTSTVYNYGKAIILMLLRSENLGHYAFAWHATVTTGRADPGDRRAESEVEGYLLLTSLLWAKKLITMASASPRFWRGKFMDYLKTAKTRALRFY